MVAMTWGDTVRMALKRFAKGLVATVVAGVLTYAIGFVSTDEFFKQPGVVLYSGVVVSVLLAVQKAWKEKR